MGKRSRYEPGTFCWVDLQTTDPEGAKNFYGELFGWEAEDLPAGEARVHTMLTLDGDDVASLNEMDDEERAQGVPPHWLSYISVENADETVEKARELGGTVFFGGAFDAMNAGRMALIHHPAGAYFAIRQPKDHIGAGRVNDPGCLCLNQLNTTDPEQAAEFYKGLFGWEISREVEDPPYWGITNKGCLNGGMMPAPEGVPSHWFVYFTVEDLDNSVAKVGDLGGTTMVPPMDIPPDGRIAVFTDPQGAAFALFEGETNE